MHICAFDKNRVCDEMCVAYNETRHAISSSGTDCSITEISSVECKRGKFSILEDD